MPDDPIRIPLRRRDGSIRAYALIDQGDAQFAEHRWCLNGPGYAVRRVRPHLLYLHRELLGLRLGDGLEVDHIDGVLLDCRRANLRVGTRALNGQNLKPQTGRTSAHRGVSWDRANRRWRVDARRHGRTINLGRFDDENEAAAVAVQWRAVHMPFTNEEREA